MTGALCAALVSTSCTLPGPSPTRSDSPGSRGESEYVPNDQLEMRGAPPIGRVVGDERPLDVISVDWAALGGDVRDPNPPIRWSRRGQAGTSTTRIETPQQPIRVVAYHYRAVDASGVPEESDEAEELCRLDGGWCTFASTDATTVTLPALPSGTHVVLQAAWITASGRDVQLSYAWQTG